MILRYLFGPKAGKEEHVPTTAEYQALVNAGFAEIVPPKPQPVKPPTWGIHKSLSGIVSLQCICEACQRTDYFGGPAVPSNFDAILSVACKHVKDAGGLPEAAKSAYASAIGSDAPSTPTNLAAGVISKAGGSVVQPQKFKLDPATGKKVFV
jgi:hypothetical protein